MALPVVLAPIKLYRGDSWSAEFRFWSDAAHTVPLDLTAYGTVFAGHLRIDPDALLRGTLSIDASAAATGVLTLSVTPDDWATVLAGIRAIGWDVQVSDVAGTSATTLLRGRFEMQPDYTHA